MRIMRKLLMGVGATALVALLLTLIAPKAAHAVVAAMVQVTNTAAAPAITQGVPNLSSQIITLGNTASLARCTSGSPCPFFELSPQGGALAGTTNYTTPATQSFVITSIDFSPIGGSGPLRVALENVSAHQSYEEYYVPDGLLTNLQNSSGLVIGPGVQLGMVTSVPSGPGTTFMNVYLHGYLTSN